MVIKNSVIQRDLFKWKLCPSKMIRDVKLDKEHSKKKAGREQVLLQGLQLLTVVSLRLTS